MSDFHYPVALPPKATKSCRVVVNREDLAELLPKRRHVAQVGAGLGELSEMILNRCSPQRLVILDPFMGHTDPDFWARRAGGTPGANDHLQHFRERFPEPIAQGRLELLRGPFLESLEKLPDRGLGISWIQGEVRYPVLRSCLQALAPKMANDGQIVIPNYIMSDYLRGNTYGVIQAVNEFMVANNWEMVVLALQSSMFCDVAICRAR